MFDDIDHDMGVTSTITSTPIAFFTSTLDWIYFYEAFQTSGMLHRQASKYILNLMSIAVVWSTIFALAPNQHRDLVPRLRTISPLHTDRGIEPIPYTFDEIGKTM
ncbi:hypothetical protein V8B97DRAFT_1983421, partial [Scleroderma yunnanense]